MLFRSSHSQVIPKSSPSHPKSSPRLTNCYKIQLWNFKKPSLTTTTTTTIAGARSAPGDRERLKRNKKRTKTGPKQDQIETENLSIVLQNLTKRLKKGLFWSFQNLAFTGVSKTSWKSRKSLKRLLKRYPKLSKNTNKVQKRHFKGFKNGFWKASKKSKTYAAGKLASAKTISSPCPIEAKAWSNSGDKIDGIPFKRPMIWRNFQR